MTDATGADGNGEAYKQHSNSEKVWEIDAYSELLAEIRAAIGPSKILSAAVPGLYRDCIPFAWFTIPKIYESIDFLNVMPYDLMNRRNEVTDHHSGLDGTTGALTHYTDPASYVRTAGNETCDRVPALGCRTELMENPITGADLGKAGVFLWHDEVPPEPAESFARAVKYGVDGMTGGPFKGHYYIDKEERIF
ncbi:glycoside hydrolase family 18 protein [Macroventuria anomochaeta]|uniref:Glycoside hydrolase family 18 protein n=1 Tax=Macroventuria anomochaeta TaxID=301207 RepID=A0ACB6S7Q4_9PLEO|nr:glycoside hydrolase family 18 protein [Macroventuria anomochaeta]KAF2630300.1 glycoside hydrolase family 18 protein [Macroventuria anomochaeta]